MLWTHSAMDRRIDQRTDKPSYRDAGTHLKQGQKSRTETQTAVCQTHNQLKKHRQRDNGKTTDRARRKEEGKDVGQRESGTMVQKRPKMIHWGKKATHSPALLTPQHSFRCTPFRSTPLRSTPLHSALLDDAPLISSFMSEKVAM